MSKKHHRRLKLRKLPKPRKPRMTKHHMKPQSRRGSNAPSNLLILDEEKHKAFHFVFGNLTWEEIIALLVRTARMKGREKTPEIDEAEDFLLGH